MTFISVFNIMISVIPETIHRLFCGERLVFLFSATQSPDRKIDSVFSQNHTYVIKGIAVLFMVLHHVNNKYYNSINLQWYLQHSADIGDLILLFFSTAGKVCVPLLTILSGFGLSKSYLKYKANHKGFSSEVRFTISHLLQFYSVFWIYLLLYTIKDTIFLKLFQLYGFTFKAWSNVFLQVFGLSKLFGIKNFGTKTFIIRSFGDWFVSAIIIFYIIFPILFWITKKSKVTAIILAAAPWIFKPYVNALGIRTDSVVFCMLAFVTGILFAQCRTLDNLTSLTGAKYKVLSIFLVLLGFALRLVFSFYADYFFALTLICFGTLVLSAIKYLDRFFILFGKHSANIWLSHIVILQMVNKAYHFTKPVKYLIVLAIALLLSLTVEFVKKITWYSKGVKKLRALIEKRQQKNPAA